MMDKENFYYLHCSKCMSKLPKNKSAKEYSRLEVARTPEGILIWCSRCDIEVAHFPYIWLHPAKCNCGCENG